MARVLLINPDPVRRVLPPLGISYLSESLMASGHEAVIADLAFGDRINLQGVDLVGVTATTLIYQDARKVIGMIKKSAPEIPVVIGGAHASSLPEFVLNDSGADCVVAGEGDEIIVQLADKQIQPKGILYAPLIGNINTLPVLTYRNIDINRYFSFRGADRIRWSLPQPSVAMIGTRGCPYQCTFCSSRNLYGHKVRHRGIDNIFGEIDYMREKYHVKSIYFYDDTLTLNRKWMEELCDGLSRRKLKWICGTRVDTVNETMLRMMKKSGCEYISFGVESGSNRVLNDIIKKGITIEQTESVLKLARKIKIGIIANYMFGLPGETQEDLELTLKAVKRLPADVAEFSIFVPLPGADLAKGYDWSKYQSGQNPYHLGSMIHNSGFAQVVNYYHKKAIRVFYTSPRFFAQQIKLLYHPKRLFYAGLSFFRLVNDLTKSAKTAEQPASADITRDAGLGPVKSLQKAI